MGTEDQTHQSLHPSPGHRLSHRDTLCSAVTRRRGGPGSRNWLLSSDPPLGEGGLQAPRPGPCSAPNTPSNGINCSHQVTAARVPPVVPKGEARGGLQASRGGDGAPKLLKETKGPVSELGGSGVRTSPGWTCVPRAEPLESRTWHPWVWLASAGLPTDTSPHLLPWLVCTGWGHSDCQGLTMAKPTQPGQALAQLRREPAGSLPAR